MRDHEKWETQTTEKDEETSDSYTHPKKIYNWKNQTQRAVDDKFSGGPTSTPCGWEPANGIPTHGQMELIVLMIIDRQHARFGWYGPVSLKFQSESREWK